MAQERRSNNPLVPDGGQRQPQQHNNVRTDRGDREKNETGVSNQRNRESLQEAQRRWENDLYERQDS